MLCATPFYNSKISISNGSASLFGEKQLQLEDEVALQIEAKPLRPLLVYYLLGQMKTP